MRLRPLRPGLLIAGALVVAAAILGNLTGVLLGPDKVLSDLRFNLSTVQPSGSIVLVDIDSRSLQAVGTWPWPRTVHAELIDKLVAEGASQIAFDVDFSSASTPAADATLAQSIDNATVPVFLAALGERAQQSKSAATLNLPEGGLLDSAWPALVDVPVDPDGYVRRFPAHLEIGGKVLDAMPVLLSGKQNIRTPIVIDYSIDAAALRHFSYIDVLHGTIPKGALAGKTVIVGASALELRDFLPVPRLGTIPGSEVIALAAETIGSGRSLTRVPAWWVSLAVGLLAAMVFVFLQRWRAVLLLAALSVGTELAAGYLQAERGLIMGTLGAQLGILGFIGCALAREFDLRGMLLKVARSETVNTRRMLERVVDDGFDGIVILDERDRLVRLNDSARDLLPSGSVLAPGMTASEALPAEICGAVDATRRAAAPSGTGGSVASDVELPTGDGLVRVLEFTSTAIAIEEGRRGRAHVLTYVCVTVRDVTERRAAAERLKHEATHDSLTRLLNRRGFAEQVSSIAGSEGGGTLTYFDLDRFKGINDTLGHAAGDQILVEVARRAAAVLDGTSILACIGGDEFAVFSRGGIERATAQATLLLDALSKPFTVSGHRLTVGASCGIAWCGEPAIDLPVLMRQADLALHTAKRQGGRRLVAFDAVLEAERMLRLELEQELVGAIERGEMELAYQPQFALTSGEIVGVEALLRWRHPTRGYVAPSLFIPIAEETGAIYDLTAWVMETACRDASQWPTPIKVAVNISPVDLMAGAVPELIAAALARSGLSAAFLEVEITESAFIQGGPAIADTFDRIRKLGVGLALDDFGTGYSSLGYLHKFPFTKLKIDRSFITGIPGDRHAMTILSSIIVLAQGLGLQTIAEGIETPLQREALASLGCELGQGYLFSRPVTAAQLVDRHLSPTRDEQAAGDRAIALAG